MPLGAVLPILLFVCTVVSSTLLAGRAVRYRSVAGVAMPAVLLGLCSCLVWLTYGLAIDDSLQLANNLTAGLSAVALLVVGHRCGTLRSRAAVGALVVWVALCGAALASNADGLIGASGLALSFISRVPQSVASWKRPGGLGVSAPGHALVVAQGLGWVAYAITVGDSWVIVSSLQGSAHAAFVVFRTVQARRRQRSSVEQPSWVVDTGQMTAIAV